MEGHCRTISETHFSHLSHNRKAGWELLTFSIFQCPYLFQRPWSGNRSQPAWPGDTDGAETGAAPPSTASPPHPSSWSTWPMPAAATTQREECEQGKLQWMFNIKNWRRGPFICLIVVVFHRSFTDASPWIWQAEWRQFWHNCYLQECQQWLWLRPRLTWMPTQDCGVLMFRSAQADCKLWKRMQMGRLRLYMFCWVLSINSSRQRRTRSLAVRQNSLMVSVHNMFVRLLGHIKAAVHHISSLSFFKLLLKSWCSFDVFSKGIERQSDPCPQCYFTHFFYLLSFTCQCIAWKKKKKKVCPQDVLCCSIQISIIFSLLCV